MNHRVWNYLAHASIIIASMFLVFFCIDRVNPAMDFLGSSISKWLLLLFILCALCNGIFSAIFLFRKKRHAHEQSARRSDARRNNTRPRSMY